TCHFLVLSAPATPEFYTLSLHDALPIYTGGVRFFRRFMARPEPFFIEVFAHIIRTNSSRGAGIVSDRPSRYVIVGNGITGTTARSEEHTSELQSRENLVCRLLLEKKNTI